ncbi:MAG: gamma-glutamylcyclotransferase family protein [Pseudomonadota bacterium]
MLYLAYGSNLHPLRLQERVPSAALVGVVRLDGYRMLFAKQSHDGSGKCMIVPAQENLAVVYGAIYEIEPGEKPRLDAAEGRGAGYEDHSLSCEWAGETISPFTYLAQEGYIDADLRPYRWYLDMAIEGARYHGFADDYIAALAKTSAIPDPDAERNRENQARVAAMVACNKQRARPGSDFELTAK